jgi:hypothetical protein
MVAVLIMCVFVGFINHSYAQSSVFAPIWLEKGVYAEYSFGNGFRPSPINASDYVTYDKGIIKWECIDLKGNDAKLRLVLSFYTDTGDCVDAISGEVRVNAVNRSVYGTDGTLLGTTQLWQEPNPITDVIIWNTEETKIFGKVESNGYNMKTPQGLQEIYYVTGNGTINDKKDAVFSGFYDVNTGLLINGLLWNEPTLTAINAQLMNGPTLSDTNIDLGPSVETTNFSLLILMLIIIGTFIGIFIMVYWKRSNKKRR